MKLPRQLFIIGGAALVLASIAMAGVSFNIGQDPVEAAQSPDPTFDPCQQAGSINTGGELSIASTGEQCITPTEETLPKTHTPEPKPTDEPRTETPNTQVPPTRAPATNTPSGGAGAGGLKPPSTGTGGDAGGSSFQWLMIAGGMLVAAAGIGSMGYGVRRK